MMWKLLNKLFGWDYVAWSNCVDQGIARIHIDGNGNCYYWRYKGIKVADRVTDPNRVLWLTCPPSKYLVANG